MTVGKWYNVVTSTAFGEPGHKERTLGRCIWVYPRNRFGVLEFYGRIRECFTDWEIGIKQNGGKIL